VDRAAVILMFVPATGRMVIERHPGSRVERHRTLHRAAPATRGTMLGRVPTHRPPCQRGAKQTVRAALDLAPSDRLYLALLAGAGE
jgi:hypothetical protein